MAASTLRDLRVLLAEYDAESPDVLAAKIAETWVPLERAEKAEAEVERLEAELRYASGEGDEDLRDEHGGLNLG
jgi:hypothetical protein